MQDHAVHFPYEDEHVTREDPKSHYFQDRLECDGPIEAAERALREAEGDPVEPGETIVVVSDDGSGETAVTVINVREPEPVIRLALEPAARHDR